MKLLDRQTLDEIASLTKGLFRFRELWIRETTVAGSRWQEAHLRREIISGGGRTICTLSGSGRVIPDKNARQKFASDTGNPEVTSYGAADVRLERLDEHHYRVECRLSVGHSVSEHHRKQQKGSMLK